MEKERALAHIERVHDIKPIPNADNIELVHVLGWQLVALKGEFKENDFCVYIEIDSKVPVAEPFMFLESSKFKIKTIKLRKQISQGIALPVTSFKGLGKIVEGKDVTKKLGIVKILTKEEVRLNSAEGKDFVYRTQVYLLTSKHKRFFSTRFGKYVLTKPKLIKVAVRFFGDRNVKMQPFPKWIAKTDEVRLQNLPDLCASTDKFQATEKIDGTSTTFAVNKNKKDGYEFIVCSRNVRQFTGRNGQSSVYLDMADKYKVEEFLTKLATENGWSKVVLQGETFGADLQGNPYNLTDKRFLGYNFITDGERWDSVKASELLKGYIEWVPFVELDFTMLPTVDEMLAFAEGTSLISNVKREGVVLRSTTDANVSVKIVSNSYLLKKGRKN